MYCYVKEISRLNVTQRKTLEKLLRSIRSEKGTRHRIIRNCWTQEGEGQGEQWGCAGDARGGGSDVTLSSHKSSSQWITGLGF